MIGLLGGLFVFVGFIVWDRRTMISIAKQEVHQELQYDLEQKSNAKLTIEIVETLKDFATINNDMKNVISRHNLEVA